MDLPVGVGAHHIPSSTLVNVAVAPNEKAAIETACSAGGNRRMLCLQPVSNVAPPVAVHVVVLDAPDHGLAVFFGVASGALRVVGEIVGCLYGIESNDLLVQSLAYCVAI